MENSRALGRSKSRRSKSIRQAGFQSGTVALLIFALVGVWGCGGGANPSANNPPSPNAPAISMISPNTSVAGGVAFTLTIEGANFVKASTVTFGGATTATTFVTSTELTAAIPASSVASSGTIAVTVTNPASSGGTSNPINFTVTGAVDNPVPTISALYPSCVPAGEQFIDSTDNLLSVIAPSGGYFVAGSVVRWNGSDRPTSSDAINGLVAQISASDIAVAGTAAVTVFNPGPGGGSSNSLVFTINTGAVYPQ